MEESKSHEDKEAHKIASLESGAGGDVGSARRIGPQQGGGKPQPAAEGCVMFRAWSRDAWVFVSVLCFIVVATGIVANYTSFWEVTAGGACSDYLTVYLYKGVCFGTSNGPETCHSWKDLKKIYDSDSALSAVDEYYKPSFGLFTAGYAIAAALAVVCIIGKHLSPDTQFILQNIVYMGGFAVAAVMISGVALTRHTFYTNEELWFTSCPDVTSSPNAGYVLGMAGWILSVLVSCIAIFPTFNFFLEPESNAYT